MQKDKNNYLKNRTVCKSCYNKNRRKNNNNTLIRSEQPKNDNDKKKRKLAESVNNRTLNIGFSKCGKTYLMNHVLYQKQERIFIIAKSLNQNPNIKTQTSDEIQPVEQYENRSVVSDDMLLSKQESNIDLFFTRGRHKNIDIYYNSQSYFHLTKNTFRENSNTNILFKQTLRDNILLILDIAALDMNLEEWKQLCRKAWEKDYEYLQLDRFAKIGNGRYAMRIFNKNN